MGTSPVKRSGLFAGCFDPFPHTGHLWAMQQARERAGVNWLIVALHTDPSIERPHKARPVIDVDERRFALESIRWVDEVIVYDTEAALEQILHQQSPAVRVLGEDYRHRTDYTGHGLCPEVFFAERKPNWSATSIRQRIALLGTGNRHADAIRDALASEDREYVLMAEEGLRLVAMLLRKRAHRTASNPAFPVDARDRGVQRAPRAA